MAFSRTAARSLALAFLILLPVQFFLAGLGIFGGEFEVHEAFGAGLLHLVVLLIVIAALVAREWKIAGLAFGLFVVIFLQIALVGIGRDHGEWIAALHPFLAFSYWPFVYFLIWLPLSQRPMTQAPA